MTKQCSQCKQLLLTTHFNKQHTGKDGLRADCKECKRRFVRSKRGLVKQCFNQQHAKTKRRGYSQPDYSEEDFYKWAIQDPEFHELFEAWELSDYKSNFKPSFDRINDYISYRLNNIRATTWAQNNANGHVARTNGSNTKDNRAVDMLTLDNVFIARFHSVSEAARHFNGIPSNISGAINNRVTHHKNRDGTARKYVVLTAYKHKWRYSTTPNDNREIM